MTVALEERISSARRRLTEALGGLGKIAPSGSSQHHLPHRSLLVGGIAALVVAVFLVGYFDRRAAALERQQTLVILQQVCERTATVITDHVRDRLDAAVLETLEGIGHPQLIDYDLPRVASFYSEGLRRHPYIDRFFLWSAERSAEFGNEVLFFSPTHRGSATGAITAADGTTLGAFESIPDLGHEILQLARATAGQRTFVVLERTIAGVPYQLVIHLLWNDERREEFFGIIGYTVNLQSLGSELFEKLLDAEIRRVLNPDPRSPRLVVTVVDAGGAVVYGPPPPEALPSAAAPLDLLFFPAEPLRPWLAERPPEREWRIIVSAAEPPKRARLFGGWLVGSVVLLIFIAVFCAVTLDRQAIRLSQMQSDFVANVSHQLKTPVSLLSATLQTLHLERVPLNKLPEYLEIALSQTTRLTLLVERILHFSRFEASPKLRLERLDLVPLIAATVERFRADAQARHIPIRFETGVLQVHVGGDAQALEQVLVNLLENALNYGDDHNEVLVRVETVNGYARMSVRDHGSGIQADDLAHVFEKFYRGHAGNRGRRGFGLGLALVASVVRAHHGRVRIDSEAGQGSTFYVELPVTPESTDDVSDSGGRGRA